MGSKQHFSVMAAFITPLKTDLRGYGLLKSEEGGSFKL